MSRPAGEASAFPVVVAGPSGGGKTTIVRTLEARRDDMAFSVSATTRPPREGERNHVDYRFLDRPAFEELIRSGGLLEWAEVHGELYGTPRANLDAARASGAHLLLDIDVQGARSVRRLVPECVTIFVLPPDGARVVERLRLRGSEDDASLRRRLRAAEAELEAIEEFDYVVVNDDLRTAVSEVEGIVEAERQRVPRRSRELRDRVVELKNEIQRALLSGATAGRG